MVYMDEWEYHAWLSLRKNKSEGLLAVEQTSSGEVSEGSAQHVLPEDSKYGSKEE